MVAATSDEGSRQWLSYLLRFALISCVLEYALLCVRHTWVQHLLVDFATVRPAAGLLNLIVSQDAEVFAYGHTLASRTGTIDVKAGCEGIDGIILLMSAILAFRTPLKQKLLGVASGTILMYTLNIIRIAILFLVQHVGTNWFDMVHTLVAPTIIVLAAGVFFLIWSRAAS